MKELKGLKINSKIEIEVDDLDYGGKYLSRVMEITKKDIRIMAPMHKGQIVPVHPKTPVTVFYIGERAIYSFQSVVLKRFKDPIPCLALKLPDKFERIQRREYVRLRIQHPLSYRLIENIFEVKSSDSEPYIETSLIDISGGGVKFLSEKVIETETCLEIKLGIEEFSKHSFIVKVIRYEKREDNLYEIGVAFESIPGPLQDQIVSWIFDKQREFRRRGLV